MEAFEHFGRWWLPEKDELKVGGVVRFSPHDGVTLEVAGRVEDRNPSSRSPTIPILLGRMENGKAITLYQCDNIKSKDSFGIDVRTFRARWAFVGIWFETEDEIRFSSGSVRFTSLPDWVGNSAFQREGSHSTESSSYTIRYERPAELVSTTHIGEVKLSYGYSIASDPGRSMSISQIPTFVVEASEYHTISDWIQNTIYPLQILLTLAMRRPASISDLTVLARTTSIANNAESDILVTVLYEPVFHEASPPRPVFRHDILFSLDDVRADFEIRMLQWFKTMNDLKKAIDRFYSIKFRQGTFLETRFLIVVQSIEAFHRLTKRKEGMISKHEHNQRIESILAEAPEAHRDWLAGKLTYSNEPTLARRLKDLIEDTSSIIMPLLGNRDKFIRQVVDTRNFLTHYSEELESRAASASRLYWITNALTDLFEACLISTLGFTSQQTRELFAQNQLYQLAAENPIEWGIPPNS